MNVRLPGPILRRPAIRVACAILALAAALTTAAPAAMASPTTVAAAPDQAGGVTYRLADTWEKRPWSLEAGRFGQTADVSSAPDGTIFVLDSRHKVVHVLAPDGTPIRVFSVVKDGISTPRRLDAGWDGTVYVLSDGPRLPDSYTGGIDQFTAEGEAHPARRHVAPQRAPLGPHPQRLP